MKMQITKTEVKEIAGIGHQVYEYNNHFEIHYNPKAKKNTNDLFDRVEKTGWKFSVTMDTFDIQK